MADKKLEGKRALVTGSSKGIGKAIALRFADEGADVAINYHSDRAGGEETARLVRELGRESFAVRCNVGEADETAAMFEEIAAKWNGVDILVNCAGISPVQSFLDVSIAEWRGVIATNLEGAAYCTQKALPYMISQGHGWVVNISSVHAQATTPGRVHYAASKGGLEAMTRALAVEFGPKGIRFNALTVGAVNVERSAENHNDPLNREVWKRLNTVGRVAAAEEITGAALLLASPEASFINGASLAIDGGKLAKSMGLPEIIELLDSLDNSG